MINTLRSATQLRSSNFETEHTNYEEQALTAFSLINLVMLSVVASIMQKPSALAATVLKFGSALLHKHPLANS